ncbi:HAMP domain-containing histidine kinase [Oscillibacter valericigenes]|uniref:histidine kinase n=1 Tax=Oscillibacter valericigenes TaxID=351091 RepID=A0ABS2FSS1_9FIRM|nr:HAMP domain-containing sensor histidine kinase [Oscillibacter valericigenes]MBM6850659.1 HAMP domain-containing histidine kinase [Oscillibacter valericigenes]
MKAVFVNGNMEQDIKQEIAQAVMGEDARPGPEPPRRKTKLTERTAAKITAFLLLMVVAAVTAGGALGAAFLYHTDIYTSSETAFKQGLFESIAWEDAWNILDDVSWDGENRAARLEGAERYCAERNIAFAAVYDKSDTEIWRSGTNTAADSPWKISVTYDLDVSEENVYTVELVLDDAFPIDDDYAFANWVADLAYALRYWIYAIIAAAALLTVICFAFLLCAAGHHPGVDGIRPGWGTKIPLDLLTAAVGLGLFLGIQLVVEAGFWSGIAVILGIVLGSAAGAGVFTGWCMSLALRIKLGGWWRNTVIYVALRWAWKVLKKLGGGLRAAGRGLAGLLGGIPLVGKTVLIFLGLCVLEGLGILVSLGFFWSWGVLAFLWVLEKILLFLAVLAVALMCRKLLLGGRALAAGDLAYQVDTSRMVLDFKSHGEDLNHIAQGMAAAVDQRMRSERMKTELITNVSHDIKTPLTSIINYADLIGKEPRDSEKIPEYAAVLTRQSERLKRLIEDLVEASKASTGNLEVDLAPCQPGVLLTQAAGEYEQRLKDAGLDLVTRQPETAVTILADGRRLWRVFDNLMNNICKYAQRGTRVYLTLEERDGQAVISFKNTSRAPLDIPAEELLERFVRGDAARGGEGNGLGLSIARSLTELQKGTLDLTVDGDLFKVVLRFGTIS